jgi:hypothetical protein
MNMSDSFYLALCMTALILGAVYWFWTQTQYIQRKVNLLENIVYEMKATLSNADGGGGIGDIKDASAALLHPAEYPPAPSSELGDDEDLLHEELTAEAAAATVAALPAEESPAVELAAATVVNAPLGFGGDFDSLDSLQPGGVGSGVHEQIAADSSAKPSVLNGMTLKELRRLAEQKGVTIKNHMRKQELIDAILGVSEAPAAPAAAPADIKPFETVEDDAA